ncbi:Crp/Fnr family transcriptional regulator [Wenyingzhuangia aestuarii]|uniref:Crp/Fnr family transcriptional regulator n=1 Tax=Wenyingzhuangia aestuarii TaxID=1647582 RepID=UPI00143C375A|nr:Crp/Fnr family transcriptional regulator [Wenyingzhuangia aestuarii]NJB83051.1 CRP-like cAMP-binding protein [Wenyingzhuangia aestuarii]
MLIKIIEYYEKRGVTLPQEEIDTISMLIKPLTFKKKEFLFKKNDTKTSAFYIVKGCVRVFIKDKNNKEYNRFFAFDDWWIGEYHQIINRLPSTTTAQALERTDVITISQEAFDIIFTQCPVFTKSTLNFYLSSYAKLLEKEEIKKTMTIEELYDDLIKNKPMILDRIPLYHIASYLGVKAESLSRVKKKFKD